MPIASLALLLALAAPPIGEVVPDLEFVDARYAARRLSELLPARATVLFFTSKGCPIAERYLPLLGELERRRRPEGVRVAAVNVGESDSIVEMAAQGLASGADFPFVRDFDGIAAEALGVTRSGEVALLDAERRLVYRGRVDGRFRFSGASPSAGRDDLAEAIDDVLAGRPVRVEETPAEGCLITRERDRKKVPDATFARDVAPILAKHCRDCHRSGGDAPFPLETFEDAARRARTLAEAVRQGRMPPWFAPPEHAEFVNRRGLSPEERRTVLDWVAAGAPRGDAAAPAEDGSGGAGDPRAWKIGEPDLVVTAAETERIPAAGRLPYRYLLLPHLFAEDTWIERLEIRPENPRVVHHANLGFVNFSKEFDPNENFLTGLVPGGVPMALDAGTAVLVPKGSALGLEVHYVPTGREEEDRISVGIVFPRAPVEKRLRHLTLASTRFEIPPGAPAHPVRARGTLAADSTGVALFAHMHWRGKDVTFTAEPPGGRKETLLAVPNYSFDWQVAYLWPRGAKRFPKGTRVECLAHFDNSAWNPFNPDPAKTVRFGLQTEDEMMYGFFFYTEDGENLALDVDPKTGFARGGVTSPR